MKASRSSKCAATALFHSVDPNTTALEKGIEKESKASPAAFSVQELKELLSVDDTSCVLGIDEAGRGPVIGPMVYSGASVALGEHPSLVACGVADSKQIDEAHREACLQQMRGKLQTLEEFTHMLTPEEIAADMFGTKGRTLNTLSHDTAIQIISEATLRLQGKLCAVFVDTVGPPEAYQARLQGRFPHLHVVVRAKADALYPVVSAASIVAKVTRDDAVRRIQQCIHRRLGHKDDEGEPIPEYVGCGYPSDPRAMQYVRSRLHRFFVHTREDDFIRSSWAPVTQLANREDVCVPVLFEEDARRLTEMNQLDRLKRFRYEETPAISSSTAVQKKLSFEKPPPKRHPLFSALGLSSYVSTLPLRED